MLDVRHACYVGYGVGYQRGETENHVRNLSKRYSLREMQNQEGFTLIELMIVVGIIVALAAVVIPLVI